MSLRSEIRKPLSAISRSVQKSFHELRVRSLAADRPPDYSRYLQSQLHRSLLKFQGATPFQGELLIQELDRLAVSRGHVLCIGCRSTQEIEAFEQRGFQPVSGVDLFSTDARIHVMDFHHLAFDDDSFDVVFASHSLEHSLYPQKAASEFVRVCRPQGLIGIEVPVQFALTEVDLQDYRDLNGLCQHFLSFPHQVLWSELVGAGNSRNRHGNPILRVVMQKL